MLQESSKEKCPIFGLNFSKVILSAVSSASIKKHADILAAYSFYLSCV